MATGMLPGHDLVAAGLDELARGEESIAALLVSIGAPRLRALGIAIGATIPNPEEGLYKCLAETEGDAAHGRYNALVRRLVSFERAVARELADRARLAVAIEVPPFASGTPK